MFTVLTTVSVKSIQILGVMAWEVQSNVNKRPLLVDKPPTGPRSIDQARRSQHPTHTARFSGFPKSLSSLIFMMRRLCSALFSVVTVFF